MSHHAYYFAGENENGIDTAIAFAKDKLGLSDSHSPDISILKFGIFSVEDARKISDMASRAPTQGSQKLIVIAAPRIFEQAQNALLKIFEEPPTGVTLVLVIPSEGILLPTLRSRLLPLPFREGAAGTRVAVPPANSLAEQFVLSDSKERAKLVTKLIDLSKSDNDDAKQAARASAISIMEGLVRYFYAKRAVSKDKTERRELMRFLSDLDRFMPLMHTRSAPLKLIFEHILLVFPE